MGNKNLTAKLFYIYCHHGHLKKTLVKAVNETNLVGEESQQYDILFKVLKDFSML